MTCDHHTEKFYDSAAGIAGLRHTGIGEFTLKTTMAFESGNVTTQAAVSCIRWLGTIIDKQLVENGPMLIRVTHRCLG